MTEKWAKTDTADKARLKELDKSLAEAASDDPARGAWNKERGEILTRLNAPEDKPAKIEKAKVQLIDNVLAVEDKFFYPFMDMKPGQGFFVPNEPNQTTRQNAVKLSSHVAAVNDLYYEVETDQNGDEVWEDVYVKSRKWENDKLVLDARGYPITGHDPVSRPNVIYARRYAIRHIAVDDFIAGKKSEKDGVLVVRVV